MKNAHHHRSLYLPSLKCNTSAFVESFNILRFDTLWLFICLLKHNLQVQSLETLFLLPANPNKDWANPGSTQITKKWQFFHVNISCCVAPSYIYDILIGELIMIWHYPGITMCTYESQGFLFLVVLLQSDIYTPNLIFIFPFVMMMMVMTMMKLLTDYTGCFSQFRSLSQLVRMGGPLLPKLKPHLCGTIFEDFGSSSDFFLGMLKWSVWLLQKQIK